MLIEFTAGNYKSVRDPVTLSLLASNRVSEHRHENIIHDARMPLLKTAVLYGPNASGKSNVLEALVWMRWWVINSQKETQAGEPIRVTPFKLDVDFEHQPSHFEVTLFLGDTRYRYGFEVNAERVLKEWLFRAVKNAETELFVRMEDDIDVSRAFSEGRPFVENTRPNALFLSTVASLNGPLSVQLVGWFQKMIPLHGFSQREYIDFSIDTTIDMLLNPAVGRRILEMVQWADLGIEDLQIRPRSTDPAPVLQPPAENAPQPGAATPGKSERMSLVALHKRFKNGKPFDQVALDFRDEESHGTQKFFNLIGPVLHCLKNGSVMVADELETKLHPMLTRMVVRLFHSQASNPLNAQLIFATHDVGLLQGISLRRDQVWFTEKTAQQATRLYSLAEIRRPAGKIRKDASYEKDYFRGRYGAVPDLTAFDRMIREEPPTYGEAD